MRTTLRWAAAGLLMIGLAGCGDDSGRDLSPAAKVPDDLCASVPPDTVQRWGLHQVRSTHDWAADAGTATCGLAGVRDGRSVTIDVSVRTLGDKKDATARERRLDAVAGACDVLAQVPGAEVTRDSGWSCRSQPAAGSQQGAYVDASRLSGVPGLLVVRASTSGRWLAQLGAEVPRVATAIATSDAFAG